MLQESQQPKELWAEAVVTACYIRNRSPVGEEEQRLRGSLFYEAKSRCVGDARIQCSGIFACAQAAEDQVGCSEPARHSGGY